MRYWTESNSTEIIRIWRGESEPDESNIEFRIPRSKGWWPFYMIYKFRPPLKHLVEVSEFDVLTILFGGSL